MPRVLRSSTKLEKGNSGVAGHGTSVKRPVQSGGVEAPPSRVFSRNGAICARVPGQWTAVGATAEAGGTAQVLRSAMKLEQGNSGVAGHGTSVKRPVQSGG